MQNFIIQKFILLAALTIIVGGAAQAKAVELVCTSGDAVKMVVRGEKAPFQIMVQPKGYAPQMFEANVIQHTGFDVTYHSSANGGMLFGFSGDKGIGSLWLGQIGNRWLRSFTVECDSRY